MTLVMGSPRRLAEAGAVARGTHTMANAMAAAVATERRRLINRRNRESGRA
jgi:hypothetical protein